MKIKNVSKEQIDSALAATPGVKAENYKPLNKACTSWNLKLTPSDSGPTAKWRKINPMTGRRIHAVNVHGFARFFRELYRINPDARIESALFTFTDKNDFESNVQRAIHKTVGPMMYPYSADDCAASDRDGEPIG